MKQNGEGHLQREAVECVSEGQKHYTPTEGMNACTHTKKHMMSTADSVNESGTREDCQQQTSRNRTHDKEVDEVVGVMSCDTVSWSSISN